MIISSYFGRSRLLELGTKRWAAEVLLPKTECLSGAKTGRSVQSNMNTLALR